MKPATVTGWAMKAVWEPEATDGGGHAAFVGR
jgi:hypothetical protein